MVSNECKVCFSRHCDMLLLPCAHLALCEVSLLCGLVDDSGVRKRRILNSQRDEYITHVSFVVGRSIRWYIISWLAMLIIG
jgi:hypothetical protein